MTESLAIVGASLCVVMALGLWARRPTSVAQYSLLLGLLLLGVEAALDTCAFTATQVGFALRIQQVKLLIASVIPGVWLTFSLAYGRGNARDFLRSWLGFRVAFQLLPPLIAGVFLSSLIFEVATSATHEQWAFRLGFWGQVLCLVQLAGAILVLMNLERTFRSSVGIMRWRIKYLVLGLALIFGTRIYLQSQFLLYQALDLSLLPVTAASLVIGGTLVSFSLIRSKMAEVDVYPSGVILYRSLTGLLAGAYLVIVGVLAKVVVLFGGASALPFAALLVFAGLVGAVVLLWSDRVRQWMKRQISRHFGRPAYDYRKLWEKFTQRTTNLTGEEGLCRATATLLAESFEVLAVTVWLVDSEKSQLRFIASTAFSDEEGVRLTGSTVPIQAFLEHLRSKACPVDVDPLPATLKQPFLPFVPDYFGKGGGTICCPVLSQGELLGVITLGERVSGVRFGGEDLELLSCLSQQSAASLMNIRLSERLAEAKQLEAFQSMSAFFVHDLKNTASTLTLMLENMAVHFDDPEFRQDAMRSLSKSVDHLQGLIRELGVLRQKLDLELQEIRLNDLVLDVLEIAGLGKGIEVETALGQVPAIAADPAQIGKVLTNLIMNARDALDVGGRIRIETFVRDGSVVMRVIDTGAGMDPDFIARSLFRPFRTTKRKGMGIGLFHSKMIVEAHKGRIEIESVVGTGTTFSVILPLTTQGS